MKTRSWITIGMLIALAGGLVACNAGGGKSGGATYTTKSTTTATPAAKPAPKAEPAPAPQSSGGNVAYYPSGRRDGSALMVEKFASGEATVNGPAEYRIRVTNLAGSSLENVVITESVPAGFTVSSMTPQGSGAAGGATAFNLGTLGAGQSKDISVKGSFSKAGSYTGCTTATYTVPVCMTINVVSPALTLTKAMAPEALLCDNIPVRLVVTNTGSGSARNVVIKDPLAAGLSAVSGGATEWNVGTLAAGQSATKEFSVKAEKVGTYSNAATATAEGGLTANSETVNTVVKAPVLTIDKKCPGTLRQGQPAKFEITVSNTGNAAAANTVVRDPVPAGATFRSATDGGALQGNAVVWNLGSLAPGASRTVSVTMTGNQGTVNNSATVTATCAAAVSDACSTSFIGVPDIGTTVNDGDGVVMVGDNHTYTVDVRNQGQVNLTNTKMVVTLPDGMTFVSSASGATAAGSKVTFDFGTLAPGQIKQGSFIVKSSKAGELLVVGNTTCTELKTPVSDEELTNFVE